MTVARRPGRGDPRAAIASGPARPDELDEPEFQRLVGVWSATPPAEVAVLLRAAPFRWWLVGGWALELAGGRSRAHVDTDVAFLDRDRPEVRRFLGGCGLDLWAPRPDGMRPILPGTHMLADEDQLWARRGATAPWLLDLLPTPTDGDDWVFNIDHRIRRPLAEVAATSDDGIPYLCPEVALLHKARLDRPKDREDLADIGPRLSAGSRSWLRDALAVLDPEHAWLARV